MKKLASIFLAITIMICVVPFGAFAFTASAATSGDYTYTVSNDVATITGVVDRSISGDVTIPSKLDGYPVTSIGNYAFNCCWQLTSITIPNSVTSIGDWAFLDCDGLTSIIIPDSVASIGDYAFDSCDSLASITIPNSVTRIGDAAFSACYELQKIETDDGNKYFSNIDGVLSNKDETTILCYPAGKTSTSYTIPNSVTSVGDYAFSECNNLASITIPDGVTSIGSYAFYRCTNLTSITIPDSVNFIDYYTFSHCEKLSQFILPETVIGICAGAFENCTLLEEINIPDGIEYIDDEVFYNCAKLKTVSLPNGLGWIGSSAFEKSGLTNIEIPDSLTRIGIDAFSNCDRLKTITIPSNVSYIEYNPFNGCDNLTNIYVEESNEDYTSIDGVLYTKNKTKLLAFPAGRSGTAYINEETKVIGHYAFEGGKFTKITIPESVEEFGLSPFSECKSLSEITILNSSCDIVDYDIARYANPIIKGYKGSTAEQMAKKYGKTFINIDTYNDYYEDVGKVAVVTRNKNGTTLSGCTITVGEQQYIADGHTTFIDIPDGYTGEITVSKDGYITSSLSVEMLKKYNFFVMYPNTETNPIIQHYLLNASNNSGNGYTDMLRSSETIYDLGNKKHDIFISVNPNGHTVNKIYLLQGETKVTLENGMNKNINSNSLFSSEQGTIYLCIETSNGTIYKMNSNIVAAKTRISLDANIAGSVSGVIDEELTALGGMSFTGNLDFGKMPISITMEENKIFGAIGVKGNESSTSTWYNDIKRTITSHENMNGDKTYKNEAMEQLEKKIQDSGGDLIEGYSSFGINTTGCILGFLEANWNPVTCKMENVKIGMILKIGGTASYKQQSAFVVLGVTVPYYWSVQLGLEIATQINGKWEYGKDNSFDFSIEMPELTIGTEIGGKLCLGYDGLIGGGGQVKGGMTVTFKGPYYDFDTSVWVLSYEAGLTGQIAGYEGDLKLKDGTYQIYPIEQTKTKMLLPENLMSDYAQSNTLLASTYSLRPSTYSLNPVDDDSSVYTFKSNGYAYSSPSVATLSDGTAVMVWVDYDTERNDINKTALYYSVFNPKNSTWSTPAQVENDGTADDYPVLKTFNDTIYLVWNDADKALENDATFTDMLSGMGISYAEFNGSTFTSVSSVTKENNGMDLCADITVTNGQPTVVWVKNEENDIFGGNGTNVIMKATRESDVWASGVAVETDSAINSLTVVTEDDTEAIYYSADADGALDTFGDYEIFKLHNETTTQITNNSYPDTSLSSVDGLAYWVEDNQVVCSDGTIFECYGVNSDYKVIEDNEGVRSIVYTVSDTDGNTEYKLCKEAADGTTAPISLVSNNLLTSCFDVLYRDDKLLLFSNEVNKEDLSSCIKVYEFANEAELSVDSAYYDAYTLMEGGKLRVKTTVKNNGCKSADNYTIYAYVGDEELASLKVETPLETGEEQDNTLHIDLPEDVNFDQIELYVVYSNGKTKITSSEYVLQLSLKDISLENAMIISNEETSCLDVSVVNRGISDLENIVVKLRKDSEDGDVICDYTIASLSSRQENIVTFDISEYADETKTFYVTIDALEGEKEFVNNSDFASFVEYLPNEITVISNNIHNLSPVEYQKPTCTKDGHIAHQTCTHCDLLFDMNGNVITDTVVVKTGHSYTNACDKSCNTCGATRTISHKYNSGKITKKATCKATGVKTYTCSVCKDTKTATIAKVAHTYSSATCTQAKTCKVCGVTSGKALGHTYKTTITKATLSKNGKTIKKCTACGKVASTTTIKYAKSFKLSTTSYTYNGKVKTPSVIVKDSAGKTLKKNTDYTVSYSSGRKNVGTYKVTIKMKGKYSGTNTLTFKINPVKTSVSKLTAGKKSLTVNISKKSTQVSGYQVQYSTSKKFTSAKTKTVSSYKTTKYTLKSLSAKKTYYVRVRTYKTVSGKKYYSGWSSYKYVKTK